MNNQVLRDIDGEINKARKIFPAFHSHHEAFAVIKEEFDELWDCIKNNSANHLKYSETIQIMAMCHCYIEEVLND